MVSPTRVYQLACSPRDTVHEGWLIGERVQRSFHSHVALWLWACGGMFTMVGAHLLCGDDHVTEKQTKGPWSASATITINTHKCTHTFGIMCLPPLLL